MADVCDLCGGELRHVYEPQGTRRGLEVCACVQCGLVQSLPRIAHVERHEQAISSNADWGNVRYGKGFRVEASMRAVERFCKVSEPFNVFDVGSSRGDFFRAMADAYPNAAMHLIEPDKSIGGDGSRIEDLVNLQPGYFDLIHCCHTLEHLASPRSTLLQLRAALKDDGVLIVDVPNITAITSADNVEEWFIDKHLYHFSPSTLSALLLVCGYEIAQRIIEHENIQIVARKAEVLDPIVKYRGDLTLNRGKLKRVAAVLHSKPNLAIWGAGRIFDALVVHGGFNAKQAWLVDPPLKKVWVHERHGVPLASLEDVFGHHVETVAIMSRGFAGEIEREARKIAPDAEILQFSKLMGEV